MSRFAVVDLSNLFARARHVVRGDAYDKAGMMLLIVFRSLRKLHRDFKIDHVVFAVDHGSWRHDVYPLYKARRRAERAAMKPAEQEEMEIVYQTLNSLVEFLDTKTRCTVLRQGGIEGDDYVARWVQTHLDDTHYIVSGDSDFVQLLAPNVVIYDGVNERMIALDGVTDHAGTRYEFEVDKGSGKVKVKKKNPDFVPEPEWWHKALFVKIVRGDSGDGIFSAYPGISFTGSSKRVGIQQAWDDRADKGYHWNNFMLQEWQKATGMDSAGNPVFTTVRVADEYRINEALIDLSRQPDEIKARMDEAITAAISKPPPANVGVAFLKFCHEHNMPSLVGEANDHAKYLNAGYPNHK